jgi:Uma2 family endonuclease
MDSGAAEFIRAPTARARGRRGLPVQAGAGIVRMVAVRAGLDLGELHRYSLEEYHRLIESGGFDEDQRVELLDGLLVSMSPKTPRHERAVRWLARWLIGAVDEHRYEVGVASPLTLATSEPEPDLVVFERDAPTPYHPASAALVIEVAVSSLSRDLGVKPALYAAGAIAEYWVLDLEAARMVVHRHPTNEGYAERFELGDGQRLTAAALDLPPLEIDALLRVAHA